MNVDTKTSGFIQYLKAAITTTSSSTNDIAKSKDAKADRIAKHQPYWMYRNE